MLVAPKSMRRGFIRFESKNQRFPKRRCRWIISWDIRRSRQPGAEQPTQWRSQNQADDNEGQFVPTALPRCWPAGQSGHAGHGVRWMAGDCLSAKANSPPTCER